MRKRTPYKKREVSCQAPVWSLVFDATQTSALRCENIHIGSALTVVREYVVLQGAFQVETTLADVALEFSHACVRQFVGLQYRGTFELRGAKVAGERKVRCVDYHVGP